MVMQRSARIALARPYRSHVARMFVAHAEALGLGDVIADSAVQLDDAGTLELPFPALITLCERVAELAGDPYVGLTIATALPPGSYGVVEYVVASSATVGDAVQMLARFGALTSACARTEVMCDPIANTVTFQHWIDHPLAPTAVQVSECALAAYQCLGAVRIGHRPRFLAVHVMHDRRDRRRRLEAHFDAPVVFGAARNAFVIDAKQLERPIVQADARLLEIVTERAERELSRVNPAGGVAAALASAYRALLTRAPHSAQVHNVARVLGLSVRSLHRRLAEEGTSFRQIEATVKCVLANEYLASTERTLERIATNLGFANTSGFIRAYKRWTGQTPSRTRA